MTLVAAYAAVDHQPIQVHVLACTERHHIINQALSFVDLELYILVKERSKELRIVCDRPIPTVSEIANEIQLSRVYGAIKFIQQISNVGILHFGYVYDFQRTIEWNANRQDASSYNTRYRQRYHVSDARPKCLAIRT